MAIIVLVIVLVVLAAAATLAGTLVLRRRALRHRFGAEYDQLVRDVGQRQAQAELAERRRRVAQLNIRPLSPERRAGYSREWISAQEQFVDSPARSVAAAAALVLAVAADRGYPAGDDNQLLTDLSVYHANQLEGYRRARQATEQAGLASTEDLRVALLGHRAMFRDLLGPEPAGTRKADTTVTAPPSPITTVITPSTPSASRTSSTPAAAIARTLRVRGDRTRTDKTAVGTTTDDDIFADSDQNGRTAAPAARKE